MNFLAVFIGGGLGSVIRYGISLLTPKEISTFPIATFISNILACLLLAILIKYGMNNKMDERYMLLAATGFCGGFSTFSTFSLENIQLIQSGHLGMAILNSVISIIVGGSIIYYILTK